jgi:hypothetical protein
MRSFVVMDSAGQNLAYVYFEDEPGATFESVTRVQGVFLCS